MRNLIEILEGIFNRNALMLKQGLMILKNHINLNTVRSHLKDN